jgi:hypothetical protein
MVLEAGLSHAVYELQTTMKNNLYGGSAQNFATVAVKCIFLLLQLLDGLKR